MKLEEKPALRTNKSIFRKNPCKAIVLGLLLFHNLLFISQTNSWEWIIELENKQTEFYIAVSMSSDSYGNIFAWTKKGNFTSTADSTTVYKISKDGQLIWKKKLGHVDNIVFEGNGNIVLAGSFSDNIVVTNQPIENSGGYDYFVQKLDENFNHIWTTTFTSPKAVMFNDLKISHDGSLYFTGHFQDTIIHESVMILDTQRIVFGKLNPTGQLAFMKPSPIKPGFRYMRGTRIAFSSEERIYVVAERQSVPCDYYCGYSDFIVYDKLGNLIKIYEGFSGPMEDIIGTIVDHSGNLAILEEGGSTSLQSHHLIKADSSVSVNWQRTIGTTYNPLNLKAGMAIDLSDNIWLLGDAFVPFGNTADTLSLDTILVRAKKNGDIILSKINTKTGKYLENHLIGSMALDHALQLHCDEAGNMILAGVTTSTSDTIWAGDKYLISNVGSLYLAKLRLTNKHYPNGVEDEINSGITSNLFPNPTEGIFTISRQGEYYVNVFDAKGSKVYSGSFVGEQRLDLIEFPAGLYLCLIESDGITEMHKLIINPR